MNPDVLIVALLGLFGAIQGAVWVEVRDLRKHRYTTLTMLSEISARLTVIERDMGRNDAR